VQLSERAGSITKGETIVVASAPLSGPPEAPVLLRIDAHGKLYDFSYATTKGKWITLKKDADGSILSTAVAGGFSKAFVGTMFGMYAYSAP
jgi:xylan 1,4-beta-xylosidase